MKYLSRLKLSSGQWLSVAILASSVTLGYAVTIPHSFTAGTPVRASEVNANFDALKTAVDALENSRQLLAMNDFACRDPSATSCIPRNHNGRWLAASSGSLLLVARLSMPEDAILSDVWCHFHDNSSADASFRVLRRDTTIAGPGWTVLTSPITTAGASAAIQTLQASPAALNWTVASRTADNRDRAFLIEVTLPYSVFTISDDAGLLALNGCYYEYTTSRS